MSNFGPEFLVNTTTIDQQYRPVVAGLPNGRFAVAWSDESMSAGDTSGATVRVQVFNTDGTAVGTEFVAPTTTLLHQELPAIAALNDGRFVVAWRDSSASGGDQSGMAVRAQVFNCDGTRSGAELVVPFTTEGNQYEPSVAGLNDGRFVVTWSDGSETGSDTDSVAVRVQVFNADGSRLGDAFLVNTTTASAQSNSAVTGLVGGGFAVVWRDDSGAAGDNAPPAIRARLFDGGLSPVGNDFVVNTVTSGAQSEPAIAGLADGSFVVVWVDESGVGSDLNRAIHAQLYHASGHRAGDEFLVNTTTVGHQSNPSVTGLGDGRFVITWHDRSQTGGDTFDGAIRGQLFLADGTRSGGEFLANTTTVDDQGSPSVAPLADGRYVVVWQDTSGIGDTSASGIRGQIMEPRITSVNLSGTPGPDQFIGTGFDDTLSGGAGDDLFFATGSGTGEDVIDGGSGVDSVVFSGPASAYLINPSIGGFSIFGPGFSTTVVGNVEFAVFDDMTAELAPVIPENHPPMITSNGGGDSASVTVSEGASFVTTVTATDPDPGTGFAYYIFGSPDAELFQFDDNGNLSFITPPVYQPDAANTYVVQIGVSDIELFDQQTITVHVTEVTEGRGNVANLDGVLWLHDDGTVATAGGNLGVLPSGWEVAGAGDFDRDGDSDPLFRGDDGAVVTWEFDGGPATNDLGVAPDRWHIVGADDFDGDGDDDILWQHDEGLVVVWEMEAGQYVVNHNLEHAAATWQIDGTGDFDGDGDADILWRHDEGMVVTWEMQANDYVINHNLPVAGTSWHIRGTGDFDADGDADILWHHAEGMPLSWEMENGALVTYHALPTPDPGWQIQGAHDFDHDGDADILWRHGGGEVATWEIADSAYQQTHEHGVVSNAWQIRATGDFDLA